MEEYYFLFGIAVLWVGFSVIQDLRTREIANWVNFSLIAFVLAYRAFYAAGPGTAAFFYTGLAGVFVSVVLAYMFYYGRIFGGGDAKMLMGMGGALPYASFSGMFIYLGIFILALFLFGSVWTLVYSAFLIPRNKKGFVRAFRKYFKSYRPMVYLSIAAVIVLVLAFMFAGSPGAAWVAVLFLIMPYLFMYVKAIEEACMIRRLRPSELTVGDWLLDDVDVGGKKIKKTVHGLMPEDIKKLRKAKKSVYVKDGVPFTPAFLVAYVSVIIVFLTESFGPSLPVFLAWAYPA